jgi:hypothetical protein
MPAMFGWQISGINAMHSFAHGIVANRIVYGLGMCVAYDFLWHSLPDVTCHENLSCCLGHLLLIIIIMLPIKP